VPSHSRPDPTSHSQFRPKALAIGGDQAARSGLVNQSTAKLPSQQCEAGEERVRVLVADDHAVLRQGLVGLLEDYDSIDVVGEAADGLEAVKEALRLQPDVVLMDITMPQMNGIEATRRIKAALPRTFVVALSMHDGADMAEAMLNAGAWQYLRKDVSADTLITAILGFGKR